MEPILNINSMFKVREKDISNQCERTYGNGEYVIAKKNSRRVFEVES